MKSEDVARNAALAFVGRFAGENCRCPARTANQLCFWCGDASNTLAAMLQAERQAGREEGEAEVHEAWAKSATVIRDMQTLLALLAADFAGSGQSQERMRQERDDAMEQHAFFTTLQPAPALTPIALNPSPPTPGANGERLGRSLRG